MTIQNQRRQHEVITKLRQLQSKENKQGGLEWDDDIEQGELEDEAHENGWTFY